VHSNRIYATEKKITELGLANSAAKWISANTVIIAMYGATAGNVAQTRIPLTTNQACCNMICHSKEDAAYLFFHLLANQEEIK
jgi:type I restriction enzyme S subunit